jgi:hypothetical protein
VNRNGLYLQATLIRLGLSRKELATLCDVRVRTVGNWLTDRNLVPPRVWIALALVQGRIAHHADSVLTTWKAQGRPKMFTVPVPDWELRGPALLASWEALDALEAERVYATLTMDPCTP